MPSLDVVTYQREGFHVLDCSGEVDLSNAVILRDKGLRLVTRPKPQLVVDLSKTTFIDSSGLSALVAIRKEVFKNVGDIRVVMQPNGLYLMQITGMDEIFPLFADIGSAFA